MKQKIRLDIRLQQSYPEMSRNKIQSLIMQGKVSVKGKIITKPGILVLEDDEILMDLSQPAYVSRAGFKLAHALDHFHLSVKDKVILDAGISTGGFTDCLLQRGAKKVYGIDVGYGQVHEKVKNDTRLVLKERTNLRYLSFDDIGEHVDMVTLDLSFISVLKVLDVVCSLLKPGGDLVVLIKPQFEAERPEINRGGIAKNDEVRERIVRRVIQGIAERGFIFKDITPSTILGATGNQEFLAYFTLT